MMNLNQGKGGLILHWTFPITIITELDIYSTVIICVKINLVIQMEKLEKTC